MLEIKKVSLTLKYDAPLHAIETSGTNYRVTRARVNGNLRCTAVKTQNLASTYLCRLEYVFKYTCAL